MNYDQVTGVIRAIVPALLAFAVGKGWIAETSVGDITAAVIAIGAALWSVYTNKSSVLVGKVAAMPEVAHVTVNSTPEGIALKNAAGSTPQAQVVIAGKK